MPPEITFPLEQSTILIVDEMISFAGVFPIAVTTKLNDRSASALDVNLTLFTLNILASLPRIEYPESPQSDLLKINEDSV